MRITWKDVENRSIGKDDSGKVVAEVHDDPGPNGRWRAWGLLPGHGWLLQSLMRSDDREECKRFCEERDNG